VKDVEAIAKDQGVEFKPADILIIRSGWVKWYNGADDEERIAKAKNGHEFVGLAGNEESVEWLWDHHFAAVAGDAIAFEAWPPKAPYSMSLSLFLHDRSSVPYILVTSLWSSEPCSKLSQVLTTLTGLHDHFLAFWGTPIGELWNLEGLAEACKRENKYSFMLTSAPLNIQGGVASPPNAIAIL